MLDRFKEFLRKNYKAFQRFHKSHPIQLIVVMVGLSLIVTQFYIMYSNSQKQNEISERILGLETINTQNLNQKTKNGEVAKIISHEIKAGTWLYPQQKNYLEIVDKNNKSYALEFSSSSILNEEMGKMMFSNSLNNPITFTTGNKITESSVKGVLTTTVFLFAILLIITFAQKMTAEVLGGHSFKASKPDLDTNLDNVIGYENVKRQLRELKMQLENPKIFEKNGVKPPKGILFTGDPGVGKTLLAKAFANEMNAEFFTCTGADFAEMYVGVGAKRVRNLFMLARMSKIAVIFIDEIDALGSRENMGNDTERLNTLNALLSEMDGVNENSRLIIIGATNFEQRLDSALKRPGRFDMVINIPLPDNKTREGMLRHYLKNIKKAENIDYEAMALRTNGYSGAQIKNIILEATRLAARENGIDKDWVVTNELLHRAQEVSILGINERNSHNEDLVRVAVHELGHALVGYIKSPDMYVEKVTVKGLGNALGYAFSRPIEDKQLNTKKEMEGKLAMMMAGRAAEEVILNDVTGGASDDIYRANELAKQMVVNFGMGTKSKFVRPQIGIDGRIEINQEIKEDISEILDNAYNEAINIIKKHKDWMLNKSTLLMQKGLLVHEELFNDLVDTKENYIDNVLIKLTEEYKKNKEIILEK